MDFFKCSTLAYLHLKVGDVYFEFEGVNDYIA